MYRLLLLALTGCAAAAPILGALASGAQWLGSAIGVADAGQQAYFAKHPHQENEYAVADAVLRARQALAALDGTIAALDVGEKGDLAAARTKALEAYAELFDLLKALRILDGKPPDGGAESSGPEPGPLALPPPDVMAHRLGS
jgi:hypothetical protein